MQVGTSGGTVKIVGGQLFLDAAGISTNTMDSGVGPLSREPGQGIDIKVSDELFLNNSSFLETVVLPNAPKKHRVRHHQHTGRSRRDCQ